MLKRLGLALTVVDFEPDNNFVSLICTDFKSDDAVSILVTETVEAQSLLQAYKSGNLIGRVVEVKLLEDGSYSFNRII